MQGNRGVAYIGPGKVEIRKIDYPGMEHNGRKLEHAVILRAVATNTQAVRRSTT
jgi:glutathione-independent formaldehyde dehydrogenase